MANGDLNQPPRLHQEIMTHCAPVLTPSWRVQHGRWRVRAWYLSRATRAPFPRRPKRPRKAQDCLSALGPVRTFPIRSVCIEPHASRWPSGLACHDAARHRQLLEPCQRCRHLERADLAARTLVRFACAGQHPVVANALDSRRQGVQKYLTGSPVVKVSVFNDDTTWR